MNRGICLSLSALTLFLVACVGEPGVTTQEEQPTKESTGPFFRGEVGPGRYSEAVFGGRSAGEAHLVRAQEGYFEDMEPMQVSNNGIVRLHEVATGAVYGTDQPILHDRYYCTFVSVRTGCVYARETGSICDGAWRPDGQWETTGGALVDISAWRVTAQQVASGSEALGEQIDNSYENLLHCDPPDDRNRSHHEVIARHRSRDE